MVFNATALLVALAVAWLLGVAALQGQAVPWQSLALGRLLAEAGAFPGQEAVLFTAAGSAFDGRSWGWDFLAAQAWVLGGEPLLRGADALWLGIAGLALAAAGFRRGARPFSTALFTAWALLAARPDLHPGPALLGWALFCVALWLMEGPLEQALLNRWIWLPPMALLGANLHPSAWALAPLSILWLLFQRQATLSMWAKLGVVALLLLCLGLHPQGPWAHANAWRALAPSPLWPGAFDARQGGLLLLATAGLLSLSAGWVQGPREALLRDRVLLGAFTALALFSRDALPWALALAAPLGAQRLDQLVDALPASLRSLRWPVKVALLASVLGLLWRGVLAPSPGPRPGPLPKQSIAFYEQELLNLRILCPPEWTAFLAHRLVPHAAFALDQRGRAPAGAQTAALSALGGGSDALENLQALGAEAAWLPLGSPLALRLTTARGWQPVTVDNASVLYVRDQPAVRELVRVHAPRGLRPGDPVRPFEPSRLAQAEADLEMRLARNPDLGVLYLFQAELWLAKGHEAKARQTLEAGIRADPGFAGAYARLAELRARRGDKAEARVLYSKALRRQEDPRWRQALAALERP